MKKIQNSITAKFVLLTLLSVIPVVIIISYVNYRVSASILLSQTKGQAQLIVKDTIEKMKLITKPIEEVPLSISGNFPETPAGIENSLRLAINTNPNIFGMAAAFEPNTFGNGLKTFCPYVFKKNGRIQITRLDTPGYNYLQHPWYTVPKKLNRPVWSEPYFDKGGGNVLMSTYSLPVTRNNRFIGVLTADFSLQHLDKIVGNIHVLKHGYAFLLSAKGIFLSVPDKGLLGTADVLTYAEQTHSKSMKAVGKQMLKGKPGFMRYRKNGKAYHIYFRPMPTTGWLIGIVFPEDELFEPLHQLISITALPGLFGILLIALIVALIAKKATFRIMKLATATETISAGNFAAVIPPDPSGDELGKLNASFRTMQSALRKYIEELKEAIAKKQRIESELSIARDIQMGILPKIFPPFPEEKDIDVFAMIEPAREVGGDLYDFFFVDPEHFCFLIGDVSGKGVPASLFMAVAKTLIKAIAGTGKPANEILKIVNTELASNNNNCMFVTVFIGILNIKTGEIHFTSAGHNPPVHIRKKGVSFIQNHPGPAIGIFPDIEYTAGNLKLAHGESLFLYTDGVNEAFNAKGEQYSNQRLEAALNLSTGGNSAEIIRHLFEDVTAFVDGATQSDDITMLNIRYTG